MNNRKFNSYLKNKTVALVGPASYLSDFELGNEINSKDIIIRINRGMELVDDNKKHIGNRTDILYNCLIENPDNGGIINIKKLKDANVKWICTIPYSSSDGKKTSRFLHPSVNLFKIFQIYFKFNFHIYNYKSYSLLNKKISSRANTGFAAIFDLLEFDLKELYITGFSFYLDSFFKGYKSGCKRNEEVFSQECFKSRRHNQKKQWEYLKNNMDNKKLTFDPILKEILNMSKLDRNLFNAIIENVKS